MVDLLLGPTKVRNFLWGKPPSDPKEAKLLFKIDCFVLSYVCLLYWVNYLDRSNVANAYVSGMQEELHMKGIEYNVVNTVYTVGFIVGMIPSSLMLLKIRPRYWLSFSMFAWGLLTLGLYKVTSYKQICVIRFFQAIFESSTFTGSHILLGSWYNSHDVVSLETGRSQSSELTKRSAVFTSSGLIANIFSGFMQSAIYSNMDGLRGLSGWRWLFIIDFIITMPICLYGLIFFPDTPQDCKAFYFSEEEIELALTRVKRPTLKNKFDWTVFKRVFGNWHWYMFVMLFAGAGQCESFNMNGLFALWLKYYDYSVADRNHLPMGMYAVGIFSTFAAALYVDHTGGRYHWHISIFIAVALITASILILARPDYVPTTFAAHYLTGISYSCQATYLSWANLVCQSDLQERAIIIASMNTIANSVTAWWSILFYNATSVPEMRKGCYAMFGTVAFTVAVAATTRYLQLRDNKKALMKSEIEYLDAGKECSYDIEAVYIPSKETGIVVDREISSKVSSD